MRGTWDDVVRRLAGAILALDLGDVLIVGDRRPDPKRGFFGGLKPVAGGPRRYVQVTAAARVLIAECVGSTSFGGEWRMDAETEAALLRQGWEKPWSPDLTTYLREAPLGSAPRLARALVRALQTLGCEVADLDVELTREEPG